MKKLLLILLLTLAISPVFAALEKKTWKFDFGPQDMQTGSGWIRVSGRTIYNAARGYGWVKEWARSLTWPKSDAVELNGACGGDPGVKEGIFVADLPDGVYNVTIQVGSNSKTEGRRGHCVELNGRIVLPAPGVGGWGKLVRQTMPAVVTKGKLTFRLFASGKGARLNIFSLVITPAQTPEEAEKLKKLWEACPAPGETSDSQVTIQGKTFIETGVKIAPKPGAWLNSYKAQPLIVFSKANPGDILNRTVPVATDLVSELKGFACAGEYQPYWLGLYGLKDLEKLNVKISDFISNSGKIAASKVTLYTVTCHYQSLSERPGKTAKLAAELLEKNFPFDLKNGKTQPLYLVVSIPANQPAGQYTAKLTISGSGSQAVSVPVKLKILPFKLHTPAGKDWQLWGDLHRWQLMPEQVMRREIDDFAAHGITGLKANFAPVNGSLIEQGNNITGADFGYIGKGLKYAHSIGINRTLSVASTNMLLNVLRGWQISQSSGAVTAYTDQADAKKMFTIKHSTADSKTDISMRRWGQTAANANLTFKINYRNTGSGTAYSTLTFYDPARRRVYGSDVKLNLNSTDDKFKTVTREVTVPAAASQFLINLNYTGPGELVIDQIALSAQNSTVNMVTNPAFLRHPFDVNLSGEWPEQYIKEYVQAIKANGKAIEELGFKPFMDGTDEAGNNPKTEKREINELKYARQSGYKTWCNLSPELAEKSHAYLDAVCFYADLFGNEKKGREIIEHFRKLGKEIYYIAAGTYTLQDFDLMPNRYNVGYFFWKSGCDGTAIWTFQRTCGDPYNDFDATYRDHLLVYPPRQSGGEPVSTIAWEGIREGVRDFRYLYTLEEIVKEAERNNRQDIVAKGRAVLDFIRQAIPWYNEFSPKTFDNETAASLRKLAAWSIMNLSEHTSGANAAELPSASIKVETMKAVTKTSDEKIMLCPATDKAPELDGSLKDPVWSKAAVIDKFYYYQDKGTKLDNQTKVYMLHDKDNLYIGFKCFEKNMGKLKASQLPHDGNVFADDSIEMLFDTTNNKFDYLQLCFNAAGSRFDMQCAGGHNLGANTFAVNYGRKKVRNAAWNADWQVKTAKFADRWEAEVVIPFKATGRTNDMWGIFFGRNSRASGETSSNEAIGFFNQPDKFKLMALSGGRKETGLITDWSLGELKAGPTRLNLKLAGADGGRAVVRLSDRKYSAPIQNGICNIDCDVNNRDHEFSLEIDNRQGETQLSYTMPLLVPPPVTLDAFRQVFFNRKGSVRFELKLALSSLLSQSAKVNVSLQSEGRTITSSAFKPQQSHYGISVPLEKLNDGFYALKVEIIDQAGKKLAEAEKMFAIVPEI